MVAGEVRKLAERSQAAAAEIGTLSVNSIAVAEQAEQLFQQLVPEIEKTAELVQEIGATCRDQQGKIVEIHHGMRQLEQVVQQNAASSEELATTSEELAAQAEQLLDIVGNFTVLGEEALPRQRRLPPRAGDHPELSAA